MTAALETIAAPIAEPKAVIAPTQPPAAPSVGAVFIGAGPDAEDAARCTSLSVFVAPEFGSMSDPSLADRIVDAAAGAPLGRLRNLGFRRLKKLQPDIAYVQFVESGVRLDPDWLGRAVRFMERRPKIAAIEGAITAAGADWRAGRANETGERQTIGGTFLARVDAFEAAAGFRADLAVNETADLCIRLRRRGGHVWKLAEPMAHARAQERSFWASAVDDGYRLAHGMSLHGGPPERLFVRDLFEALFWGAGAPIFLFVTAAAATIITAFSFTPSAGLFAFCAVLTLAAVLYGARALYFVISSLRAGAVVQWADFYERFAAPFAQCVGVWRFYAEGKDPRRSQPSLRRSERA